MPRQTAHAGNWLGSHQCKGLTSGVPCIAIVPFRTFADPGTERAIADGIVCDIIGRLTRFRRLDVIARASTFTLHGANDTPREIGQRLLADYLVHGDIGLNRGRLRIAVELVDTTSEKIIWGQTFDEDFGSVFDIQDRLSEEIVLALMVEVDRTERHRVYAREPESLDAYSLCLRGEDELFSLKKESCETAKNFFERAVRYCPDYARARASIARTHGFMWKYRWSGDRDRELELARDAAAEAVKLDYNDARAHSEMGWVSLYSREHDRALEAYSTALRLNPGDADIIADYADALKHNGTPEEAVPLFERAIRLNPLHADIYLKDLAHTHFVARDFDTAIATVHRMRRPGISRRVLAASYALAGQVEDAKREAEIILQENPSFSPEAWVTMVPDRHVEYTQIFLEGMKRAGL
jgi:TolB-like protein